MRDFACPSCGQRLAFEKAVGNLDTAGCNWVVDGGGTLCHSCALSRTRPADGDREMPGVAAERAKRRLALPPHGLDRMAFVHRLVTQARGEVAVAS